MKKWTILISVTNVKDRTAFVYNKGIDEQTIIKRLHSNGFEKVISENELKLILSYCIINGTIEGVYELSNNYNRDQSQINIIKDNIEKKLMSLGYKIISHCFYIPEYDNNKMKEIMESRNYLHTLNGLIEKNKTIIEQQNKILLENEKISKENIELKKNKNRLQNDVDILINRYNKGKEIVSQQDEITNKLRDSEYKASILDNQINKKQSELTYLNAEISKLKIIKTNIQFDNAKAKCDFEMMKDFLNRNQISLMELQKYIDNMKK